MTQSKTKKKPILVAVDLRDESRADVARTKALRTQVDFLARELGLPAELAHVDEISVQAITPEFQYPVLRDYAPDLRKALQLRADEFSCRTSIRLIEGFAVPELVKLASKRSAYEMLAIATHGRKGISRALLGSVAEEVVRHARVPSLVCGPKAQVSNRKPRRRGQRLILVATELTPHSRTAEKYAAWLARRLGADIVLVHCLREALHPVLQTGFSLPSAAPEAARWLASMRKTADSQLVRRVEVLRRDRIQATSEIDGSSLGASDSVLAAIRKFDPDYVVMGTHGRNLAAQAVLGSSVRRVILESPVPVVVVRSAN